MSPAFLFEFVLYEGAIEDLLRTVKKVIYEFIFNYRALKKNRCTSGSIYYEAYRFVKFNI